MDGLSGEMVAFEGIGDNGWQMEDFCCRGVTIPRTQVVHLIGEVISFCAPNNPIRVYLQGRRMVTVVPLPGLLVMESEPPFNCMSRAA